MSNPLSYHCLPDGRRAELLRAMTPGERLDFAVAYAVLLRRVTGAQVQARNVLHSFHEIMAGRPCPVSTRREGDHA